MLHSKRGLAGWGETGHHIVAKIIRVRDDVAVQWDASQPLANEILAQVNVAIPDLVEELRAAGKHATWVDMHEAVQPAGEYD
jgi:hypothetical protein